MFSTLTEKIEHVFKQLRGQAVLTEQNITDALKEVRLALLAGGGDGRAPGSFCRTIDRPSQTR